MMPESTRATKGRTDRRRTGSAERAPSSREAAGDSNRRPAPAPLQPLRNSVTPPPGVTPAAGARTAAAPGTARASSLGMANEIIGYAVADSAFEHSVPQEFAGACETVQVPAGRYPVTLYRDYRYPTHAYVELEGVSTYRGWFGSNTRVDTTPRPCKANSRIDLYELARCVLEGKPRGGVRFELAEGYEARKVPFVYDGEQRETTGIFHNGENIR